MILNTDPLITQFDSRIDQSQIDYLLSLDDYVRSRGFIHGAEDIDNDIVRERTSLSLFDYEDQLRDIKYHMLDRIREETGRIHSRRSAEHLQLTRYRQGQQYQPHYDHFNLQGLEPVTDVDRVATALLYLNDGFLGGETQFPLLNVTVYPRQGDILYFEYPKDRAELMLHAGLPVLQGEKRIVSLWIRAADWPVQG